MSQSAASSTMEIGKKLVYMCNQGRAKEVINTMYAENVVGIEPQAGPGMAARTEGLAGIKAKTEWWEKNHEIHSAKAAGPWPHGDRFIVHFVYEVTSKLPPFAGKRMTIDECGLYTVKDGKIVQEEFFYHMG